MSGISEVAAPANGGLMIIRREDKRRRCTHESLWKECSPMAGRTGAGDLNPLEAILCCRGLCCVESESVNSLSQR